MPFFYEAPAASAGCRASAGPFCKSAFNISFMVPFEFQVSLHKSKRQMKRSRKVTRPTSMMPCLWPVCLPGHTNVPNVQSDPPLPTNPNISIEASPAFTAFVAQASFGDMVCGERWLSMVTPPAGMCHVQSPPPHKRTLPHPNLASSLSSPACLAASCIGPNPPYPPSAACMSP